MTLVYGGGRVGLMGVTADAALQHGAEVIGVIPKALCGKEGPHPGITQVRVVSTMYERKALMIDLADAFVTLPGGIGTLDEFFEVLTLGRLRMHSKPYAVLNVGQYYRPLIRLIDTMVSQGFVTESDRESILIEENPELLLDRLEEYSREAVRRLA
jgi:uncharacterized protein (TIGR00730 family)